MSTTSLVTHGYICYAGQPIPVPAPASLDKPDIVGVVEVRPKIRYVKPTTDADESTPLITSAQELRPKLSGRAEPVPAVEITPKLRTIQELKPKIVDAKEED